VEVFWSTWIGIPGSKMEVCGCIYKGGGSMLRCNCGGVLVFLDRHSRVKDGGMWVYI